MSKYCLTFSFLNLERRVYIYNDTKKVCKVIINEMIVNLIKHCKKIYKSDSRLSHWNDLINLIKNSKGDNKIPADILKDNIVYIKILNDLCSHIEETIKQNNHNIVLYEGSEKDEDDSIFIRVEKISFDLC